MEMTKNRMISAQLIAMIFCRLLGRPAGHLEARERLPASRADPASATHTQTRLSVSSMVKTYVMHSAGRLQQAFRRGCAIRGWPAENQERGGSGAGGGAGAEAAGTSCGTGLANRESSMCGSISIFSVVTVCLSSVPGLALVDPERILQGPEPHDSPKGRTPRETPDPRSCAFLPTSQAKKMRIKKVKADAPVLVREFQAIDGLVVQFFFADEFDVVALGLVVHQRAGRSRLRRRCP